MNSAGRLVCTRCPAGIVISVASGISWAASASWTCGTWLSSPPAMISVRAVIEGSPAHQAGSGSFSCPAMATTSGQSTGSFSGGGGGMVRGRPACSAAPGGTGAGGLGGQVSSRTSWRTRPGRASATRLATVPPSEWPMMLTCSRPSWSSASSTSSRMSSNEYSPGHSLSPCPRRSKAISRYSRPSPGAISSQVADGSPRECSRTSGGPSARPLVK